MLWLKRGLRAGFLQAEAILDRVFPPRWNPLYHLGSLGFFYYWVVAVSGIYVYILFDTGTTEAYASVEYMTHEQWYLGGVMRSLHRYASDGMVLMMAVHILREFSLDRLRGPHWFTWLTGVPIFWLVIASGITGYWLVWDVLAQYVAVVSTEWLDWLPIFGEPVARNFLSQATLDDRFFSLLTFIHIAVPLILLFVLWIHLMRVSRPKINPNRGLAAGTMLMLLVLSFVKPATSQGPADLGTVPAVVDLDWFYLAGYPLVDVWSKGAVWGFAATITILLAALPWLPPKKRVPVAEVNLDNCNGCTRCAEDCPYGAVTMQPRSDGKPFEREAVVNPALCVSCGICAGACPTSMPFRKASALVPGIDLPHRTVRELREQVEAASAALGEARPRVLVFGCDNAARAEALRGEGVAAVSLPCVSALPPAFIDYVLSRDLAEGVVLAGCREEVCYYRFGVTWTQQRLDGERDPQLRARVPRERLTTVWAGPADQRYLAESVAAFRAEVATLPPPELSRRPRKKARAERTETAAAEEPTHG